MSNENDQPTTSSLAIPENQETPGTVDTPHTSSLATDYGRTIIEDTVIAKIAGMAAREVSGVYALGGGAARIVGSLRETLGTGPNVQQGVSVDVVDDVITVDVAIVAEYGVAIHQLAEAIRQNIIQALEAMTGMRVASVNITVHDIHLDRDEADDPTTEPNV